MTTETLNLSPEDWKKIRNIFLRYGFSIEEATWAADNNLNPLGEKAGQIKKILRNRATKVRALMRASGFSRKVVIESCDEMRRNNLERKGIEDLLNLFQGETP